MKKVFLKININQYICLGICLLLMAVIPIVRDHKIIGIPLQKENTEDNPEVITESPDGTILINTTSLTKKIIGYGGPTPVEIKLTDGKITKIRVLQNQESPEYLGAVINSTLLDTYYGHTLQEAAGIHPDAVSGATYSSNAITNNIRAGVEYALQEGEVGNKEPAKTGGQKIDYKFILTLLIILSGAVVPLFIRNKFYRYVQLILDVIILGFWGGTFICYSLMVSYLTNGITQVVMIPVVIMLVTAFIYPLFGKADHYCNWICPYGAIQDLAGKCFSKKLKIPGKVLRCLTIFRETLWFALMWLLWTGVWFDWMGYEPFAAFFFIEASPVVLGIAGGFLLLSFFVDRPYCRFVCPTGSLFKFSEGRR